jgi:hypothetical protein
LCGAAAAVHLVSLQGWLCALCHADLISTPGADLHTCLQAALLPPLLSPARPALLHILTAPCIPGTCTQALSPCVPHPVHTHTLTSPPGPPSAPAQVLRRLPSPPGGGALRVCHAQHHEAHAMELPRRLHQPDPRAVHHLRGLQGHALLRRAAGEGMQGGWLCWYASVCVWWLHVWLARRLLSPSSHTSCAQACMHVLACRSCPQQAVLPLWALQAWPIALYPDAPPPWPQSSGALYTGQLSSSADWSCCPPQVMDKLHSYAADLNANLGQLPSRGPCSRYELPDEDFKGRLELKFFDGISKGVACNLDSPGGAMGWLAGWHCSCAA